MIKAIAVDDEPAALDVIKIHAEKVPFIQLQAAFYSAAEAINYCKNNTVDLIFLDISMPDISGLEFAATLKQQTHVIFSTAHPEHALKGFELAVTDYLLKPINLSRFLKACQLVENRMHSGYAKSIQESIFVKDGHNWMQVKFDNILYIRGEDNYVSIFEPGKRTLTRMTLTELQNKLPAAQFLRAHKSYIVAINKIDKIEKHQVTIGDIKIPLSVISGNALMKMVNT